MSLIFYKKITFLKHLKEHQMREYIEIYRNNYNPDFSL